ncbi:MAG: sugar ABC transporter permease [Planctomycetes bacterium]|nr:sugar ABC transporter permease [Planctomycetota bacterium]
MRWSKGRRLEAYSALLFILPNVLGFAVFTLFPVAASLILAFFNWSPLQGASDFSGTSEFAGLANFWHAVGFHQHVDSSWHANDAFFWQYLGNTVILMAGIPFAIIGSLFIANLLSRKLKGVPLFVTVFFLPSVTSGVATYMIWQILLNPEKGLINAVLLAMGMDAPPQWLHDVSWAKPALIIMGLWSSIGGYNMVLYLASLQSIPQELYESAEIDGAGGFAKFVHITWPMVSPTTFFIFIMSLIGGFQGGFAASYIMTKGGPAGSTTTISYYIYNLAFSNFFEMGYASAVAWILFLITLAVSLINWNVTRKRVHGEVFV